MQTVSGYFDLINQYLGGNILYIFVIAAWIIFICRLERKRRRIILTMLLLLFLAVYNPLSHALLVKLTGETATYYRFLWLLPAHIMFAFFVYEAISRIGRIKVQLFTVCVVCIGIFCMTVKKEELQLPDNASQIPMDTIEVAANLEELMEAEGVDETKIIADLHIYNTIRQYDAKICLHMEPAYSLDPELDTEDSLGIMSMLAYNRDDISPTFVSDYLEAAKIDYVIISINNDISLAYMQKLHWQIIATTSAYHILQY